MAMILDHKPVLAVMPDEVTDDTSVKTSACGIPVVEESIGEDDQGNPIFIVRPIGWERILDAGGEVIWIEVG